MSSQKTPSYQSHSALSLTCIALLYTAKVIAETSLPVVSELINAEMVADIKAKTTSWKPYEPDQNPFRNKTDQELRGMLGLKLAAGRESGGPRTFFERWLGNFNGKSKVHALEAAALPNNFDSRADNVQGPCIHPVRNQGKCGSCWAFSSAGFFQDRLCIASGGQINVILSPQDLITCDYQNGGCDGGYLTPTLNYFISFGLVEEACMPYKGETDFCMYQCTNSAVEFKKYFCKQGSMKILTKTDDIKQELMQYGPLQVGFTVYEDFLNYESGIYEHVSGNIAGGHAVKLIGWNYDSNGRLYWICQNQWGTTWGENGFFNIYTGQAGIDSTAFACDPDV